MEQVCPFRTQPFPDLRLRKPLASSAKAAAASGLAPRAWHVALHTTIARLRSVSPLAGRLSSCIVSPAAIRRACSLPSLERGSRPQRYSQALLTNFRSSRAIPISHQLQRSVSGAMPGRARLGRRDSNPRPLVQCPATPHLPCSPISRPRSRPARAARHTTRPHAAIARRE